MEGPRRDQTLWLQVNRQRRSTILNKACWCSLLTHCWLMLHSLWPHGLKLTSIHCPWDFSGKDTGVGCHFLLQGMFPTQRSTPHLLYLADGFFTTEPPAWATTNTEHSQILAGPKFHKLLVTMDWRSNNHSSCYHNYQYQYGLPAANEQS